MAIWPFNKSSRTVPLDAIELQQQLVDIATTKSAGHLRRFCKAYQDQIATHAEAMRTLPQSVRVNEQQADKFIQGLAAAAQCLQSDLGDSRLWDVLVGKPQDNPIAQWQAFIDSVHERMAQLEHAAMIDELQPLLAEAEHLGGEGARQYEAILRGRLGELLFHSGRVQEARKPMEEALDLCTELGDQEGICIYLSNLVEVARYEDDHPRAVALAEKLLAQLRFAGDAERIKQTEMQLRLLRAGEPLCRIVCRHEGLQLELDELPTDLDGQFDFEFVRSRPTLQMATALTEHAMAMASDGEYADAHEILQQAAEIDPLDPNPPYQDGMVLMEMGFYGAAREAFERVEELAPGWFRCRSDRWLAGQLERGAWPDEVLRILRVLDDGGLQEPDAVELAKKAVEKFPEFAAFWLHLGDALRHADEKEAEAAYREGLKHAAEPDVESRLLCALAGIMPPKSKERSKLVNRAHSLNGSRVAEAVAKLLRDT